MALGRRAQAALAALALALLVVATYWPVRGHAWLNYDDDVYITANPAVAAGWSWRGVGEAFVSLQGANWFPLTRLSWMLDAELFGLDARAFHTTNLLLHAATTALLFLALLRLTGSPGRSAFVAAVFGVHPLHVESVAWAAARKDLLSGLCFAGALLAYAPGGAGPRSPSRIAGVSLLLALGLMAKQTLVTLPLLLLLLDAWPLGRLFRDGGLDRPALRRALLEKLPMLALALGVTALAALAQNRGGALSDLARLPVGVRLANAVVSTAVYLRKAVWPADLAVFYPHPGAGVPPLAVAGSLLLLAALCAAAARAARRVPAVTVGWLWYLIALAPVIGVVQVGAQAMADRYTYLPLIGLAIAVAWGLPALLARLLPASRASRLLPAVLALGAVALLSAGSRGQLRHWRDSEALMRHALAVTRDNAEAHIYLGAALLERGAVDEAVAQWSRAAALQPGRVRLLNNLAWLLATHPEARHRDPTRAVALAEAAARGAGGDPVVLDTLAAAYASAGRSEDAIRVAGEALAVARRSGDEGLAAEIARRLALYRSGRPWIEE